MPGPLAVTYRPAASLTGYERNARTHSEEQIRQIAASMGEFGWTNPILCDEEGGIIAGHGRLAAALLAGHAEVPTITLEGLSPEQKRALIIADNQLALTSSWDDALLRAELGELQTADFDLDLLGFPRLELDKLLRPSSDADPDEVPEPPAAPVTRTGDVWVLGEHRVMCGDSVKPEDVAKLMAGEVAQLMHADPPYGMGKEIEGIANDNLYGAKLDAFQMAWWRAFRPHLTDNGSAYVWGNAPDLWRLWYAAGGLAESETLTLRNEIVWDKKAIPGMASPDLTQYPEASERCLFFQFGRHVFLINQTKEDYWHGWEPIRAWLCQERDKMGWGSSAVRAIVDNFMYGHWFGTSQWAMISEKDYRKLQAAANGQAFTRDFAELHAEYKAALAVFRGEVRGPRGEEFRAGRPYFENSHDTMRDVWDFPRVIGAERFEHATPKPVAMMERIMLSSLRQGEVCIEPFGGTGSTLIGAERAARRCFTMELQEGYVDVSVRRWQTFTGRAATLEGGGTFDETAEERAS